MRNRRKTGTPTLVVIDVRLRSADPLRMEVPATADRLAQIRRGLHDWLKPIGVPDADVADIVLAVNEAATNCVEHAYRDSDDGVIVVDATVEAERIVICVEDYGEWRTPSSEPNTRGRGLPIIRAVGDCIQVARSAGGTTVRIDFRVADAATGT